MFTLGANFNNSLIFYLQHMKTRLLIYFFLFFFASLGFPQNIKNINTDYHIADSLFDNQQYKEAYFHYQDLEKNINTLDSVDRGKLYFRLSATAEKLKYYPKAIVYHMLGRRYIPFLNQKENQYYIKRVEQILPPKMDSLNLSRLYYRYAVLLTKETLREKAFDYYFKSLNIAKGLKNYAAVATIANDIAGEYWDAGEKELSTQLYKESLSAAIALNDSNRIAGVYLNLADNYIQEGDFKKGIHIHLKALKIKELISDKSHLSFYYQSTANVYRQARNFKKWEEYINQAYKIKDLKNCTSPQEKATLYAEMGGIAKYKGELQKAALYFDTVLILSTEQAYFNGQKTALNNLALIHKDLGNYKKALNLINRAKAFLTDNPFHHISYNNTKAELLLQMNNTKEALKLLQKNIENTALNNYAAEKLRTFDLLYKTNYSAANYKDAFRWNDSLRILENKLRDEKVRKEMDELETRYQTEKKEQQISLLTTENELKNQRIRLGILLIGLLLILVSFILFLLYFRRKQAHYKQNELQQQLLRSQMNPHFIFNVLGSIQGFLYKNEASKAADYLSRFASLSRSVLNFSSQENISLKEEIEMLQNYIELERARMENPFEIEYKIDEDLEIDFIEIPPMLLQPFVENAIKHGLHNLDYQGKLSLYFKEKSGFIEVEIVDNGNGLSLQKDKDHKSKALEIFYQRKKGIEHKFKKELNFEFQNLKDIDKTKQGVRVFIQLPILNDD